MGRRLPDIGRFPHQLSGLTTVGGYGSGRIECKPLSHRMSYFSTNVDLSARQAINLRYRSFHLRWLNLFPNFPNFPLRRRLTVSHSRRLDQQGSIWFLPSPDWHTLICGTSPSPWRPWLIWGRERLLGDAYCPPARAPIRLRESKCYMGCCISTRMIEDCNYHTIS